MKKMIYFCLLLIFLFVAPAYAVGQSETTRIKAPEEAEFLLGRHVFTDHEAFENDVFFQHTVPGMAGITQEEVWGGEDTAPYLLSAHHEVRINTTPCDFDRGYISGEVFLIGLITEIRTQEFDFKGTISGLIPNYNQIQRTGNFTFSRKKHPAYWSLQGVEEDSYPWDYWENIDIYLNDDSGMLFDRENAFQHIEEKCKGHGK